MIVHYILDNEKQSSIRSQKDDGIGRILRLNVLNVDQSSVILNLVYAKSERRGMKFLRKFLIFFLFLSVNTFLQPTISPKYVIGFWPGGMGICLTSVLNHLSYCEKCNLIPVVYWYKGLYHNSGGFNGKQNEWEYYFNPVSYLSYAPHDTINHFIFDTKGSMQFNYYNTAQEKRDFAYKLLCKYVVLNPIVQAKVDKFYNIYMRAKKTIGIHMRGTDKCIEDKPVSSKEVMAEALKYADENTQFFIATDEKKLLNEMLELLKTRKVIYYDCYRSEDGKPLHLKRSPKPSFAQLGEDVVVEM
jgi:hypothetical protein